jgi:hypothetical protein
VINQDVALGKNTNLEKLEFGSPAAFAEMYSADDLSFEWFPELLSQVTSPRMAEVGFYLWEKDFSQLSSSAWNKLSALLHSPQFSSLKRIAFHVSGKEDVKSQIVAIIKDNFARFEERGILHIDSEPDPAWA